jgi:hypothetical protein
MRIIVWTAALAACSGAPAGGHGGKGSTTPEADLTGHWEGDCEPVVTESGYTQDLAVAFDLDDADGDVSGTGTFTQSYPETYTVGPFAVVGARDGDQVDLAYDFTTTGSYATTFSGTVDGDVLELTMSVDAGVPLTSHCDLAR